MKSMKTMIRLMTCAVVATMSMEAAKAALNIPSDGSDGALVITENTVIDLSRARTANWIANNSGFGGVGIYDSNKWAVVFKYSSVTIQGGATVTFINHPSRAPVVWLVQGDVTINGTVRLDGQSGLPAPWLAVPGPGGFRGGSAYYAAGASDAAGFGPGGGGFGSVFCGGISGFGASYGSVGSSGLGTYGNPSLMPLIGGSGGGGSDNPACGGGAGGGAILIAASGTVSVSGTISARGGAGVPSANGCNGYNGGGGGSGGGIRLVAETLNGSGTIEATGGGGAAGGLGRIRIERVVNTFTTDPIPAPSIVELSAGATPVIWLPTNGPTVRIVTISTNAAPADPRAGFGTIGADVVLPQITNVTVVVETSYVQWPTETNQTASVITVRATPRSDGNFTTARAVLTRVVSEDPPVAEWTANVAVKNGYAAIQVQVVRP